MSYPLMPMADYPIPRDHYLHGRYLGSTEQEQQQEQEQEREQ